MQIIFGNDHAHTERSRIESSIQNDKSTETPLPGNERGVRQTNSLKPQATSDKSIKQIDTGLSGTIEERDVVTIDIGGVPIVIPDFEITAKPQIKVAVKVLPTQIQTKDPNIAEPKKNNKMEIETLPAEMQYFATSSESFKSLANFQKQPDTIDRFPKSHKTWRSSGPNHVFEIHVPLETSRNNEKQKVKSFEAPLNPSIVKIIEPTSDIELQTLIKFVISETEKSSASSQSPIIQKNRFLKASEQDLENEVKEPKECPGSNLEECVDDCIVLEDIYAYSGCVVQCGERCA